MNNWIKLVFSSWLLCFICINSSAQEQNKSVYKFDKTICESTAKKWAESYFPNDKLKQANLEVAIEKAFQAYQEQDAVKYEWKADTLSVLKTRSGKLDSIFSDLKKNPVVAKIKLPRTQEELQEYKHQIDNDTASIRRIIARKQTDTLSLSTRIKTKRKEIDQYNGQQRAKEKAQQQEAEKLKTISTGLEAKKSVYEQELNEINSMLLSCHNAKSLLAIDKIAIAASIKQFAGHEGQIKDLYPDLYSKMKENVNLLSEYLNLSNVLDEAIKQMAGKFSSSTNQQLKTSINEKSARIKSTLSTNQNKEISIICKALEEEQIAYTHFCNMLTQLANDYACIVDEQELQQIKKDDFFRKQITAFTNGKTVDTPYNKFYVLLNSKFQELQNNLTERNKNFPYSKTDKPEKFKNYLNNFQKAITSSK